MLFAQPNPICYRLCIGITTGLCTKVIVVFCVKAHQSDRGKRTKMIVEKHHGFTGLCEKQQLLREQYSLFAYGGATIP